MSTAIPQTRERSRFFVDRRLQGGIVLRILLHWLAFIVVGTGLAAALRWMTHPTLPLAEQLGDMSAAFGPYLVALIALIPIFVLDTIKLTNRFAGPFVRFQRHIRALRNDDSPGPIRFRDGDCWRETEDDLNALMTALGKAPQPSAGSVESANENALARPGGEQ